MIANTLHQYAGAHGEFHRVVALNSLYARKLGPVKATWLCQAVYTQTKVGPGRWWFKRLLADRDDNGRMIPPEREIDHSFEYETGMTRTQQESARKKAIELGVLKEKRSSYHARLEYLIDLDCLYKLANEWAEEERNIARSGKQEITFTKEETSVLESDIPRSSTESIHIKECRTAAADMAPVHGNPISNRQLGERYGSKGRRKVLVKIEGMHCWNDSDDERANTLLDKYGKEKICLAVLELQGKDECPYPKSVQKILSRPAGPDMVEQTSLLLSNYSEDKDEKAKRSAACKAAEQLSASERLAYVANFIEKRGPDYTSTFDFATKKFINPAENIEFKRWLETQLMQYEAVST